MTYHAGAITVVTSDRASAWLGLVAPAAWTVVCHVNGDLLVDTSCRLLERQVHCHLQPLIGIIIIRRYIQS